MFQFDFLIKIITFTCNRVIPRQIKYGDQFKKIKNPSLIKLRQIKNQKALISINLRHLRAKNLAIAVSGNFPMIVLARTFINREGHGEKF